MRQTVVAVMLQSDQNKSRQQSSPTFTSFFSWKLEHRKEIKITPLLLGSHLCSHSAFAPERLQIWGAVKTTEQVYSVFLTYTKHISPFPPSQRNLGNGSCGEVHRSPGQSIKRFAFLTSGICGGRFCYLSLFTFNRWKIWGMLILKLLFQAIVE